MAITFTAPQNQTFKTPPKESWLQKFISQPHQLFFASAIFFAILIMVLTFISLIGKSTLDLTLIHGFGLNFALFTNAFLGFLITVMPKYNGVASINHNRYLKPWIIYQIGIVIALFLSATAGKLIVATIILYFGKLFYEIIKNGHATNKKDSIFINIALILGALMLIIEAITCKNLSTLIFFGYLSSLVFIVAQRMVPSFYSATMGIKLWKQPKYLHEISTTLFLMIAITLQFEYIDALKIVSFIAMLFFGYLIADMKMYKKSPPIVFILIMALIWMEIGFIALFIEAVFFNAISLKMALHIFAIGFVTNLLIGFGSRVVMGHAVPAQPIIADKFTIFLFIFTQFIVISRVSASILFLNSSAIFSGFLHLSSMAWIILFLLWSFRYGKTVLRIS
jgi:uncharacterized protein involved in response to NO